MNRSRMQKRNPLFLFALFFAAMTFVLPVSVLAQKASKPAQEYQPVVGQEGKDVIWVPTPQALVDRMLEIAHTTSKDFVIDLGSGDGRLVITAAKKFGAKAMGIEYNPKMVELSNRNAEKEGLSGQVRFIHGDIFETDFSQATVLTLYLLPDLNLRLRPTILKMKPGTRVVSHAFSMDDWSPDQTINVEGYTGYLWIVPAPVEGVWRWRIGDMGPQEYELTLQQSFQQVEGLVRLDGTMGQVRNVKLNGDQISFTINELTSMGPVNREFVGRVSGSTIEGKVKLPGGAGETSWKATRSASREATKK